MTLKEIVEQLELCGYECEGGKLENNVAFIALKKLAEQRPTLAPVSLVSPDELMKPPAHVAKICGIVSNSGPNGEPLACGYAAGHKDNHAWADLPTYAVLT